MPNPRQRVGAKGSSHCDRLQDLRIDVLDGPREATEETTPGLTLLVPVFGYRLGMWACADDSHLEQGQGSGLFRRQLLDPAKITPQLSVAPVQPGHRRSCFRRLAVVQQTQGAVDDSARCCELLL